jgi:hypothetical protein
MWLVCQESVRDHGVLQADNGSLLCADFSQRGGASNSPTERRDDEQEQVRTGRESGFVDVGLCLQISDQDPFFFGGA